MRKGKRWGSVFFRFFQRWSATIFGSVGTGFRVWAFAGILFCRGSLGPAMLPFGRKPALVRKWHPHKYGIARVRMFPLLRFGAGGFGVSKRYYFQPAPRTRTDGLESVRVRGASNESRFRLFKTYYFFTPSFGKEASRFISLAAAPCLPRPVQCPPPPCFPPSAPPTTCRE